MTRAAAIDHAARMFDEGRFRETLADWVTHRTESQSDGSGAALAGYLDHAVGPLLAGMGFALEVLENPAPGAGPMLVARRVEDAGLPTMLCYGHGDTVLGMEGRWSGGRDPWRLSVEGDRWYGRGTADNKGQHLVNLLALDAVLRTRGRLGFNATVLIETGEEVGSPGLHQLCAARRDLLAADMLIASDGPRFAADRPTVFTGARGAMNLELRVDLRDGAHHSGNWGGLLANPAVILANAIASIIDANGRVKARDLLPGEVPPQVRAALAGLEPGSPGGPEVDRDWGEPGLTRAERVHGWTAFEVLAFTAGTPEAPVNAIPGSAMAHCQIRFTPDVSPDSFLPVLRAHLDSAGFAAVGLRAADKGFFPATRLDPGHPAVRWSCESIAATLEAPPVLLPSLGGSLPNDAFSDILGLPTIWVPHSYPGCCQHAPDEHILPGVMRDGMRMMAGLFWDLGEAPPG